ncbi:hypothetical protein BJV74DRAFT_304161 [Russula compacta]|nr:hypothetical protein BJV74DRAFT_304161 [Russula compacta]
MGVGQGDRVSSEHLLYHLAGAFLSEGWKEGNVIKEENVMWIFNQLGWHTHSVLGSRERHAFRGDWPFELIVSVESEQKKYRYTPRSDFHVSVDQLVYLLVEVQSDNDQSDRYRMLLQAACAARLGRKSYEDPFIVVALYIEKSGRVTRYFLFQCDAAEPEVSYVSSAQDWRQPHILFTAMFEIYNLVSLIQSDRPELGSIKDRIRLLGFDLSKNFKDNSCRKGRRLTPAEMLPSLLSDPEQVTRAKRTILAMACSVASTSTAIARLSMHSRGQGTRWSRTMKTRMAGRR